MAPSAEVGPSSQLGGASEALQVARALSAGAADLIRAVLDPDTGPPEQRPLREAILDLSLKERLGPPGAGSPAARAIAAQLTQLSDAQVAQLGAVRAYVATRNLSAPDQAEFAPLRTRLARLFFDGVSLRARDRGTAPSDRTNEFDKVIARLRGVGAPLEIPRTDHPVLIIPGVNTREQRAVPGVTPGYMDRNQAALEQIQGADHVVRSSISTHDSVEGNAEKLSQEILKLAAGFKQRVILFTHSKGGADAAWVLTRPEVQQSTLAVISMNAAYGGTPLATLFAKSGLGAVAQALQPESDGRGVPSLDFDVSQARDEETALEVPIIQLAAIPIG